MSIKNKISDALDVKLKRKLYALKHKDYKWAKQAIVFNEEVKEVREIRKPGFDVFCGYYDVPVFSKDDTKVLLHILKDNLCEISYYDLNDDDIHKITETSAFSYQQGSRLRFCNDDEYIFVNKYLDDAYYTCKLDLKGQEIERYKVLYDVANDESFGVGLDFDRLQRLRPGYGYKCQEDKTIDEKAPGSLYLIDLKTKEEKELISLSKLAETNDPELKYEHYLNHVSISKDNKHIMFFHLYNTENHWKTQLCVIDKDGQNLKILENEDIVSHYTWLNDEELLITGVCDDKDFYRVYKLDGSKIEYSDEVLDRDGHPSKLKDDIITDTYPDWLSIQYLIKYNLEEHVGRIICSLWADDKLTGERRCDLHPKVSSLQGLISVDSTCRGDNREVVIVRL